MIADANRQPHYGFNLTNFAPANQSTYRVVLALFQEYNPCHSILQDLNNLNTSSESSFTKNSNDPVFSNILAISVANQSARMT